MLLSLKRISPEALIWIIDKKKCGRMRPDISIFCHTVFASVKVGGYELYSFGATIEISFWRRY
jgi:hypothetical protein